MNQLQKILIDCMGHEGLEIIEKSIIRRKTNSVADPEELYLPLLVVPRAIMTWLVKNVMELDVGEHKEFRFPGHEDTAIYIEKLDTDVYRGEFSREGKIIHTFSHQTLPSISGHLLTVFELYDQLDEKHQVANKIMDINNIDINRKVNSDRSLDQENIRDLIGSVNKLVDALVLQHKAKPEKEDKEDKEAKEDKESDMKINKEELAHKARPKSYFRKKIEILRKPCDVAKGIEMPSGAGKANAPKQPAAPTPPSVKQQRTNINNSATGKAPASTPKAPTPPKAPTVKTNKPQISNTLKSEYFRKKIQKSGHFVSEQQIYKSCPHCGLKEFKKTEDGPVFNPCVCYRAAGDFVSVKKSEDGYRLFFKTEDKDAIASFLKSLRHG